MIEKCKSNWKERKACLHVRDALLQVLITDTTGLETLISKELGTTWDQSIMCTTIVL